MVGEMHACFCQFVISLVEIIANLSAHYHHYSSLIRTLHCSAFIRVQLHLTSFPRNCIPFITANRQACIRHCSLALAATVVLSDLYFHRRRHITFICNKQHLITLPII